jgi:hypothetical protein
MLDGDSRLKGKANFNNFNATYSPENGGIIIRLGTSAKASCGEASPDQQYLALAGRWERVDQH